MMYTLIVKLTGQSSTVGVRVWQDNAIRVAMSVPLWKLEHAVRNNLTGIACTDETSQWNKGTPRNVEPKALHSRSQRLVTISF